MKRNYVLASLLLALSIVLLSCIHFSNQTQEKEVSTLVEILYGGTGGVTVGPKNNIYVSDFGPILSGIGNMRPHDRVFKVSPNGKVEIFAKGFIGASGSKFDNDGNFYQSNIRGGFVSKLSLKDNVKDSLFVTGLNAPVGISLDSENNLYINNCGNNKIIKFDKNGVKSDFSTSELLKCPNGLTSDNNGNFYAANFYNGNIVKVTPAGKASLFATLPGNNNGHIVYHDNYLYAIARKAHQIYKISLDGKVELFAGTGERGRKNGDRLKSTFSYPNDLDISKDGQYMYVNEVADTISDHRVLTPMTLRRIRLNLKKD